jgi:hypothetical protein
VLNLTNSRILELVNPGFSPETRVTNCFIANNGAAGADIGLNRHMSGTSLAGTGRHHRVKAFDVTLAGASVTLTNAIPAGSYVDAVCGITTTAVTGSTGYMVGTVSAPDLYVETVDSSQGHSFSPVNSNPAFTGAVFYQSDADIIVTHRVSNFTGGVVRLYLHYTQFTPPTG